MQPFIKYKMLIFYTVKFLFSKKYYKYSLNVHLHILVIKLLSTGDGYQLMKSASFIVICNNFLKR